MSKKLRNDLIRKFTAYRKDTRKLKNNLGQTLQNIRKAAKISQTDLGNILGLHQTAVCRIEQGSQNLTPEELFLLGRFFDVPVDALLAGKVDPKKIAERFK